MEALVMFGGAYHGTPVLVTGHTGFKGSWLAAWLARLGARVVGYALDPPTEPNLFGAARIADDLTEDRRADIRDTAQLVDVVRRHEPAVVFHLAASPLVRASYRTPAEVFDVNVMGTISVLEAVRQAGSRAAVVVVSTDKCYENREWEHAYRETDALGGHDPYSASKAAMEIAVASWRQSFFDANGSAERNAVATVRAGNVIGGGDWSEDRIVPDAMRALGAGKPVIVRRPGAIRPWQHVLEPLSGYLQLGARLLRDGDPALAGGWNFGPHPESHVPVGTLADLIVAAWGEGSWERAGADDGLHEAGLLRLAIDKAYGRLAWRPVWNIQTAVTRTVGWYRCALRGGDGMARRALHADIDAYEAAAAAQGVAWTR